MESQMDTVMEQPITAKSNWGGRTTVIIPPELREAAEAHGERTGATLGAVVRVALRDFLAKQKE
ncbi:hypothetical protein ADM96_15610 [Burkholderia sp. ST111]|nr:hypothetical protein ADM96_15610 [Burkholderia sp. ST111]